MGLLKPADSSGHSIGEGALLVAEQFGFQQIRRDRRSLP
jgi:hypothetical protein